jgi:hypothetical protein
MLKTTLFAAMCLCTAAQLGAQRERFDEGQLVPDTFEAFKQQELCDALHALGSGRQIDRGMSIAATVLGLMPLGTLPCLFRQTIATEVLALLSGSLGFVTPVLLGASALVEWGGVSLEDVEQQYPDVDAQLQACGVDATLDFLRRGHPSTRPLAITGITLGSIWLATVLVVLLTSSNRSERREGTAFTCKLPTWPRRRKSESLVELA